MHLFQNFGCNYSRFYWQAAPIDNPNWSLGASRSNHLWLPSTPSPSSISISTSLSTPRPIDIPIRSPGVKCTLCSVQCTLCALCSVRTVCIHLTKPSVASLATSRICTFSPDCVRIHPIHQTNFGNVRILGPFGPPPPP